MPLMPEPPMPTKCTCWMRLSTRTSGLEQVRDARGRVRLSEPPRRPAHRRERLRLLDERADRAGQRLARELALLEHARGARGLERARVRRLVVVGRAGERHQQRRAPGYGQLG